MPGGPLGGVGAAIATSITLSAWGLWRVAEVWWLVRCFPFTMSSMLLLTGSILGVGLIHTCFAHASVSLRVLATGTLILVYFFGARRLVTPQDRALINQLKNRKPQTMPPDHSPNDT